MEFPSLLTDIDVLVGQTEGHVFLVVLDPEFHFRQGLRRVLAHADHARVVVAAERVGRVRVASGLPQPVPQPDVPSLASANGDTW